MISKEYLIEQATQIILSKKPNLNLEKFKELEFSLLIWQSVVIDLKIHEFEDGLAQYLCSYIILVEGECQFQTFDIETNEMISNIELVRDTPFYYGLEQIQDSTNKRFSQILANTNSKLVIIKESRIQQILSKFAIVICVENYYNLCEFHVLEALSKLYFLAQEAQTFISSLMHDASKLRFQKGQVIYKNGSQVDGFYLILEGEIKVYKIVEIDQQCQINKKVVQRKIVQKILGKNQSFGEIEIYQSNDQRLEQTECNSLECELLFVPLKSLNDAYQAKYQDPQYELQKESDNFKNYLNVQMRKSQKQIELHRIVHQPPQEQKQPMNSNDPLFMNLKPLNQMKYSIYDYPKDVIRTYSQYSQAKLRESLHKKQNVNRSPSQEVFVNESLAKINKVDGIMPIQEYISKIKSTSSFNSPNKKRKHVKHNSMCSIATDYQMKLINYTRQLTPLHIQKRSSNPQSRQSIQPLTHSPQKKQSIMMLYPQIGRF